MPKIGLSPESPPRYVFDPTDHNLLAWSMPPTNIGGGTVMPTAGLLTFVRIRVPKPITVTNIVMHVSTAGGTLTSGQCFAALYAGVSLVGQTADQAVAWASTGLKTMALAGGPYSLTIGNHYVAFWFNGTTGPAFPRDSGFSAISANVGLSTPNFKCGTADTSITTTAPPTMGAQTSTGSHWSVALS